MKSIFKLKALLLQFDSIKRTKTIGYPLSACFMHSRKKNKSVGTYVPIQNLHTIQCLNPPPFISDFYINKEEKNFEGPNSIFAKFDNELF